jgi:RNA polymerase sigma-70 factor (ECF subfamily)
VVPRHNEAARRAQAAAAVARPGNGMDLETAFRQYASYVATIAYRVLGTRDELEDVVQDVFVSAHKTLRALRDVESISSWLATVTVRVCRRRLRSRRLRQWLLLADRPEALDSSDPAASPETKAVLSAIFDALERVPLDARIAWTLRFLQGERLEQVAELSGCSLAAVKRRLAKAQAVLDKVVSDE